MNDAVKPQPGQLKPKIDFQMQGIQISISVTELRTADNKK